MAFLQKIQALLKNNILVYLLLTILPAAALCIFPAQHQVKIVNIDHTSIAKDYANFHAITIEHFLGETVGRMEMLATSIKVQHNNLTDLEEILRETAGKDPRFSGFYWANRTGDLLISTNPSFSKVNIGDRPYFQQAVKTEHTTVSEPHTGRVTGRMIISLATPIVDHGQLQGILIASLRLDEIEAQIKTHLKDETIIVKDDTGKTIIKAGSYSKEDMVSASMTISQAPWTITAFTASNKRAVFWKTFFKYFAIYLTIANILFLSVKYYLLQKRIKKEKEQVELHKLELIGKLAASTAHEIRNPLTGIKGLIKLLSEENQDQKAQAYYEVIQTEIDRINLIVSELLVLGKPTAYHLKTHNMETIVAEIEPIIRSEANFMNVEFTIGYSNEILPVLCVKDQLKQVLLNLTKNSFQAMPRGGKLAIILEKQSGSCIIKVEDNGAGMTTDQIKQAFNPFYTLKKDGSGLGLTVCKRIIEAYGGEIFIKSTPDEGTLVEVHLPLAAEIR